MKWSHLLIGSISLQACIEPSSTDEFGGWQVVEKNVQPDSMMVQTKDTLYDFHLLYVVSGLGSNFGKKMQHFEIKENKFIFSLQQNSYFENQVRLEPDTLQTGIIRKSTLDSIMFLVEPYGDSTINKYNLGIMSGAITTLSVTESGVKTAFQLHNCYDETASQIVDLLNPYLMVHQKLFISDFPAYKPQE